jgi:hypothetical protein
MWLARDARGSALTPVLATILLLCPRIETWGGQAGRINVVNNSGENINIRSLYWISEDGKPTNNSYEWSIGNNTSGHLEHKGNIIRADWFSFVLKTRHGSRELAEVKKEGDEDLVIHITKDRIPDNHAGLVRFHNKSDFRVTIQAEYWIDADGVRINSDSRWIVEPGAST